MLAWEQGTVSAERAGAAASADQFCLRFDHPTMAQELAAMEPLQGEREIGEGGREGVGEGGKGRE